MEPERLTGSAAEWSDDRQYGVIATSDGRRFVATASEIQPDRRGCRCFRSSDDVVLFSVDPTRADKAINVRIVSRPLYEPQPERETVSVVIWNAQKGYGFLRRECGCNLYLNERDIVTEGVETLKPGSMICVLASPDAHGKLFRATSAEILFWADGRPAMDTRFTEPEEVPKAERTIGDTVGDRK